MMRRTGRGDLIVKQPRKDETNARTACTTYVRKHLLKRGDRHGDDVAEHNDGGGDGSEPRLAHTVASDLRTNFG